MRGRGVSFEVCRILWSCVEVVARVTWVWSCTVFVVLRASVNSGPFWVPEIDTSYMRRQGRCARVDVLMRFYPAFRSKICNSRFPHGVS